MVILVLFEVVSRQYTLRNRAHVLPFLRPSCYFKTRPPSCALGTSFYTVSEGRDLMTYVSDNYTSTFSLKQFVNSNGIKHVTSAPYHPSFNGLAERAVQTMKRGLKNTAGATIQEKPSKFLFTYRLTPHSTTRVSPAELLMGHRLRSRLDLLFPDIRDRVQSQQEKQQQYHDDSKLLRTFDVGDNVYAEDFRARGSRWIPGIVKKRTGPISYIIELHDGHLFRRHVDNVRKRVADTESQDSTDTTIVDSTLTSDNVEITDQPGLVQPPQEAADVLDEVPVDTPPEVSTVELGC